MRRVYCFVDDTGRIRRLTREHKGQLPFAVGLSAVLTAESRGPWIARAAYSGTARGQLTVTSITGYEVPIVRWYIDVAMAQRRIVRFTREHKVQLLLAVIALAGVLGAAVISNLDKVLGGIAGAQSVPSLPSPDVRSPESLDASERDAIKRADLIALLEVRADRIVRELDERIGSANGALPTGAHGFAQRETSDVENMRRQRNEFVRLHKLHIAAIKRGDYVAAHELLSQIHRLLLDRVWRQIETGAGDDSVSVSYFDRPMRLDPVLFVYPGAIPKAITDRMSQGASVWLQGSGNL